MKTATITFHASHNYGSMLQAFALQQSIKKLGHENVIINLRTERQKKYYPRPSLVFPKSIKQAIKQLLTLPYYKDLQKKYDLFEEFLSRELTLTKEFATKEEIEQADLQYDCFIAGGDQLWNTKPIDFDWSFYLPFTDKKKISYSASMGPHAEQQVSNRALIKDYLSKFAHIAVREEGTKKIVDDLTGKSANITIDPALLFNKTEWAKLIAKNPIVTEDYILVYTPFHNNDVYDLATSIGKKLKYPVYTTNHILNHKPHYWNLKYQLASGPWEFLNMLSNAKLVICGSFHAVVFSALFERPFFAVNGEKDNRMKTFLEKTNLMHRTISKENIDKRISSAFDCDFSQSTILLNNEREVGLEYLKNAIEK